VLYIFGIAEFQCATGYYVSRFDCQLGLKYPGGLHVDLLQKGKMP